MEKIKQNKLPCKHEKIYVVYKDMGAVRETTKQCVKCKKDLEFNHTCQWDNHDCGKERKSHDPEWIKKVENCKHEKTKSKKDSSGFDRCERCGEFVYN